MAEEKEVQVETLDAAGLDALLNQGKNALPAKPETVETKQPTAAESKAASQAAPSMATSSAVSSAVQSGAEKPGTEVDAKTLFERIDKIEKALQHKEQFIQRQGTEIGELRKLRGQFEEVIKGARQSINDNIYKDPAVAFDAYANAQQAAQKIQQIDFQEAIEKNREQILQIWPEYDTMLESIAEVAQEDGVPKVFIDRFKSNPYATPIGVLIPYVSSAKRAKQFKEQASLVEQLKKQVTELEKKPEEALTKIAEAAKKGPALTAAKGDGTTKKILDGLTEDQLAVVDDATLDKILEEDKKGK